MGKNKRLKIIKNAALVLILSFIILSPFFFRAAANAAPLNLKGAFGNPLNQAAGPNGAGYNTGGKIGVEGMISLAITTILTFVGVIFLVLAIYGGYTWMIARGNEQEVEKAKQIIQNAVIGLVVVLAAYAISWFIINALGNEALKQKSESAQGKQSQTELDNIGKALELYHGDAPPSSEREPVPTDTNSNDDLLNISGISP